MHHVKPPGNNAKFLGIQSNTINSDLNLEWQNQNINTFYLLGL